MSSTTKKSQSKQKGKRHNQKSRAELQNSLKQKTTELTEYRKEFNEMQDKFNKEIEQLKAENQQLLEDNKRLRKQNDESIDPIIEEQELKLTELKASNDEDQYVEKKIEQVNEETTVSDAIEEEIEEQEINEIEKIEPNKEIEFIPDSPKVVEKKEKRKIKEFNENKAIQEIKIQQFDQFLEEGQVLRSCIPFLLNTKLQLPITPLEENIDIDSPYYGIHVVIMESDTNKVITTKDIAEDIYVGITDYSSKIQLPILDRGKYRIDVNAIIPFAHIGEKESLTVEVKD